MTLTLILIILIFNSNILFRQLSSSLYSFIATVKIISEKTNYGFSTE